MRNNFTYVKTNFAVKLIGNNDSTVHAIIYDKTAQEQNVNSFNIVLTKNNLLFYGEDEKDTFVFRCNEQNNLLDIFKDAPYDFLYWGKKLIAGRKNVYEQDAAFENLLNIIALNENVPIPQELSIFEKAEFLTSLLNLEFPLSMMYDAFEDIFGCMKVVNKMISNMVDYDFSSYSPYTATKNFINCINIISDFANDILKLIKA